MGFDSAPISMTLAEYGSAGHFCPLYGPLKRNGEIYFYDCAGVFFFMSRRRPKTRAGCWAITRRPTISHTLQIKFWLRSFVLWHEGWVMRRSLCDLLRAVAFNVHLGNANGRPIMVVVRFLNIEREEFSILADDKKFMFVLWMRFCSYFQLLQIFLEGPLITPIIWVNMYKKKFIQSSKW